MLIAPNSGQDDSTAGDDDDNQIKQHHHCGPEKNEIVDHIYQSNGAIGLDRGW